jgi:hypothetical protein
MKKKNAKKKKKSNFFSFKVSDFDVPNVQDK